MIRKKLKFLKSRERINRFYHSSGIERPLFRYCLLLSIVLLIGSAVYSNEKGIVPANKYDYILEPIEGLENLRIFSDTASRVKQTNGVTDTYPTFPDLVYEYKIAAIGKLSPISFDYNSKVKRYIDIYSIERREQVSQILGLSELYFPLFDDLLDKYHLPLELKYLAIVESALNPLAVSKTGAVGLWQFKINSARMFNLKVNSYVDERMDPLKSTEAACQYLQYLYKIFNDWQLVLAAYNTGPGAVRTAIIKSNGETNFWKLYDYLPESAQNYVPAFIAAGYIMNNAADHKITLSKPTITYKETDTVMVSKPIAFSVVSKEVDIPVEILRFLNPEYRRDFVPDQDKSTPIWLPSNKVEQFVKKMEVIYNTKVDMATFHDILANSGSTENKIKIKHKVKSGEYLHKIAILYGCTIDDLLTWNPNADDDLSVGEMVTVWVNKKVHKQLQENAKDTTKKGLSPQ